jgi:hypothetical protein
MFVVRQLLNHEIEDAQKFLYEIYINELEYYPVFDNPSKLRIVRGFSGSKCCDMFDEISIWWGIFKDNKLIGVHRMLEKGSTQYELGMYTEIPEFILANKSMEMNRLAINKEYRNSEAIFRLILEVYLYLNRNDYRYFFGATTFPFPGNACIYLGAYKYGQPFKFTPHGNKEMSLLIWNVLNPEVLLNIFNFSLSRIYSF